MDRQDNAPRALWTFEDMTDENDGALPSISVPWITLNALIVPPVALWVATALFMIPMAAIGHPIIAAVTGALSIAADAVIQHRYRRLSAMVDLAPESVLRALVVYLSARAAIAMTGPVAVVLAKPGAAELMFAGISGCLLLCIAVGQGQLSRPLFWASSGPVIAGLAVVIVAAFPLTPAAALLALLTLTAIFLNAVAGASIRLLGDWDTLRDRNNRLIERLTAEREEAERAREDARQAGQAKANFLATMSHEIRTPMNGVLGMAQLLQKTAHDDDQRRRIDTLIHSGEFLLSILNDILDISKIDAGKLEIAATAEDPRCLLDGLVQLWAPAAAEKGLYLTLHIADDVPDFLELDARRLRQILFNLIGNALKFTSEGGVAVTVDARPVDRTRVRLHVTVRDTGIGLDPEKLSTLFERFSQADQSTSRRFGGAGLGLAISRQLAQLMDGELWAEGAQGQGAAFHLSLPVAIAESSATESSEPIASITDDSPLSILIVDDNRVNLAVLEQILHALGHEVTQASNGPAAVEHGTAQIFDLILMDIQMPGMNGVDTLKALRILDGPNRSTPTIAVTADVLTGGRDDYLAQGFCGHVAKPIQIPELVGEMNRVLGARSAASAAA